MNQRQLTLPIFFSVNAFAGELPNEPEATAGGSGETRITKRSQKPQENQGRSMPENSGTGVPASRHCASCSRHIFPGQAFSKGGAKRSFARRRQAGTPVP